MWRRVCMKLSVAGLLVLSCAVVAAKSDPIFVQWMNPDNPADMVILAYWERAEEEKLSPEELIDLGTMLFRRGFPGDATRYFKQSLDLDPNLAEAWYRIGLVEHEQGEFRLARQAYDRCLKLMSGHGWCNFYMGRLEEQARNPHQAMEHYRRAFTSAPELGDPKVNPEVLYSKLALGAVVMIDQEKRFEKDMPTPYLEPQKVKRVTRRVENDRPTEPIFEGEDRATEAQEDPRSPAPEETAPPAAAPPQPPPPTSVSSGPTAPQAAVPTTQDMSEGALQSLRKMSKTVPTPTPRPRPAPRRLEGSRRGYHPGQQAPPVPTPAPTPKK